MLLFLEIIQYQLCLTEHHKQLVALQRPRLLLQKQLFQKLRLQKGKAPSLLKENQNVFCFS